MKKDTAVITFVIEDRKLEADLEIPLNISAHSLLTALDRAYGLGVNFNDMRQCCLICEHPVALLKGSRPLKDYGIFNGSRIYI